MHDPLTGLYNRRAFFQRGEAEIQRFQRYQGDLSLLMLDIDHFKHINDTYGHDYGDLALRCVASTLRANIRDVDIAARIGGEEFAILLPNTSAENAVKLAERIRLAVEQIACHKPDSEDQALPKLTGSIGVTACRPGLVRLDDALSKADRALYQAKKLGRNRVIFLLP